MGLFKYIAVGMVMLSVGLAPGAESDTSWLYGKKMTAAYGISVYDTAASPSVVIPEADTGDAFDSSYINFDYHFTNASSALFGPGYAGLRFVWDWGATWIADTCIKGYDSLVFVYKGLVPGHKVTAFIGASSGCAMPVVPFEIGSARSSAAWRKVSIPLPDSAIVDSMATMGVCEMRFIINNDSGTTSDTSVMGNFKVDNIALVKKTAADVTKKDNPNNCGCGSGTGLALIPPLWFKAMSYRKRKKNS